MDKEKEIEEMANLIGHNKYVRTNEQVACILFDEGYRKADEVRKETEKEILFYLKATITDGLLKNHEILNSLMREYGIEVDE